jgi:excinuclease ABC subunit A
MSKATNQDVIAIKGAKQHNLKNINVDIKRNSFTVVTGVSGSGKSSLVFDTLFAEGQRRYVESLSSYARQFLGKLEKPKVDQIEGLAPSIAIEQKVNTRNPRSTVATSTELYDYLKLLFSRIGRTFSPLSNEEVRQETVDDVITFASQLEKDTAVTILSPIEFEEKKDSHQLAQHFSRLGFSRLMLDKDIKRVTQIEEEKKYTPKKSFIVVDRVRITEEPEEWQSRMADSVEIAFWESKGNCIIEYQQKQKQFNNRFELDGLVFEKPTENFLSFNNPYGACKTCEGFGSVLGIDEDLVVPDKSLSVFDNGIVPWKGEVMQEWKINFLHHAAEYNFPVHRSYMELSEEEKDLLWNGKGKLEGINAFFKFIEFQSYKIQYRVMYSRYRGKTVCPDCKGTRLRKDANYVKIVNQGKNKKQEKISISDVLLMTVSEALNYFSNLKLNKTDEQIADRILKEILNRLQYLSKVGLNYLGLNRLSNTLSGGESQRINLSTSLGSSLVGSTYVLDEPSIGLHPQDTGKLIEVISSLQEVGNTVVVVEHDEEMMRAAHEIIDIGPLAGEQGGEVVFNGTFKKLLEKKDSLTSQFLLGTKTVERSTKPYKGKKQITVLGAQENNLKNVNVSFPLNCITAITGVSGSGKTSLVRSVLYPALSKKLGNYIAQKTGKHTGLEGDISEISSVEMIDQNPIGKSSRSNPVTYVKAYDAIRELFANLPLSKTKKLKPQHFSFNVDGGRCDECKGEGEVTIEMQFMADIKLTCEICNGKKFKEDILEVEFKKHNIHDVLNLSVSQALDLFEGEKSICNGLKVLDEVGLGYVRLGQSSNTLSGGEAQRVKLASFLGKGKSKNGKHILFIFDEPTTGLHFNDINKLLKSFEALVENGHTVIVIEHNMDLVACSDWVIDLGPEGGKEGGIVLFEGYPKDLAKEKNNATGTYLAKSK